MVCVKWWFVSKLGCVKAGLLEGVKSGLYKLVGAKLGLRKSWLFEKLVCGKTSVCKKQVCVKAGRAKS